MISAKKSTSGKKTEPIDSLESQAPLVGAIFVSTRRHYEVLLNAFEKMRRTILIRSILSAVLFALFAGLSVAAIVTDRGDLFNWLLPVAILSILALPRRTMPDAQPETDDELDLARRLEKTRLWLAYTRAIYLVIALFILFGLPSLL